MPNHTGSEQNGRSKPDPMRPASVRPAPGADDAEKMIRTAWQIGAACGLFTLTAAVLAISGHPVFGYTAWNLLDAALIFLLTFGIYRKSRTSALLLFLYYVVSKTLFVVKDQQYAGVAVAVAFSYYLMRGVQGAFVFHRSRGEDFGDVWKPAAAACVGAGILVALVVFGRPAGYAAPTGPVVKAPQWKEVAPPESGFSIQMPGEPVKSSETVTLEGGAGTMLITTYRRQTSTNSNFAVIVYDIPGSVSRSVDPYALFQSAIDTDVDALKGKVAAEKLLSLGKWPGKEVRIENDRAALRAAMFLVDAHFYRVIAFREKARISGDDVEKFFSSFKVIGADGQAAAARDPSVDTWQPLSPEGGRFRVDLPGTPSASQENVSTSAGAVVLHRFELKRDMYKEKFLVQYVDYPEPLLRKMKTADAVLTAAASADVENFHGTLVSQTTLTTAPCPGRELLVQNAEEAMRIRVYLSGGRFYKLAAVAPRNFLFTADDEKFMNSFQLVADGSGQR